MPAPAARVQRPPSDVAHSHPEELRWQVPAPVGHWAGVQAWCDIAGSWDSWWVGEYGQVSGALEAEEVFDSGLRLYVRSRYSTIFHHSTKPRNGMQHFLVSARNHLAGASVALMRTAQPGPPPPPCTPDITPYTTAPHQHHTHRPSSTHNTPGTDCTHQSNPLRSH